jgi:CheY-like chemotaxis protein/HPt (histidine-containing phosphotransfer) domain-containing protein
VSFRVLYVDDDPLMRDIVELSLGLDPVFTPVSCASGAEALAFAADWTPDLILCDVMMPDMDGPAVLARLRESKSSATIPVVFMTARATPGEHDRLMMLGAIAVITKPFDPSTLAATVRGHMHWIPSASSGDELPEPSPAAPPPSLAGYDFTERLRTDAVALAAFRTELRDGADTSRVPEGLLTCVHKLAGAAGVFEYQAVSVSASTLEETVIERLAGRSAPGAITANLDALLECIAREQLSVNTNRRQI